MTIQVFAAVEDHDFNPQILAISNNRDKLGDDFAEGWNAPLEPEAVRIVELNPPPVEDVVRCVENHLPVAFGYFRDGNYDTDAAKVLRGDLALSDVCDENEMFVYCTMDVLNLPGVGDFEDVNDFGWVLTLAILGNTDTGELASPAWSKFYNDVTNLWLQRHNLKGKGL